MAYPSDDHLVPTDLGQHMLPGHEKDVLVLLQPLDEQSMEVSGWTIESIQAGPRCQYSLSIRKNETGEEIKVRFVPRTRAVQEGGPSVVLDVLAADHTASVTLLPELLRRLQANDPGDFFSIPCDLRPVSQPLESIGNIWLGLLFMIGILLGIILAVREGDTSGSSIATARRGFTLLEWVSIGFLVIAAVGIRLKLMSAFSPESLEIINPFQIASIDGPWDFVLKLGSISEVLQHSYHPPLSGWLTQLWCNILGRLDVDIDLLLFRLPNLFLVPICILLFARIGRTLGHPGSGIGAATLFAFLPLTIQTSVFAGNYFGEMVLTLAFVDQLGILVLEKRPRYKTLAVLGALVLWTGYMGALVLIPGLILTVVISLRRRETRQALVSWVLFFILIAPLASTGVEKTLAMHQHSSIGSVTSDEQSRVASGNFHTPLPMSDKGVSDIVEFPYRLLAVHLFSPRHYEATSPSNLAAILALAGLLLFAIRRGCLGIFPLVVTVLYASVSTMVYFRPVNTSSLWPFLLLVPLVGFGSISWRFLRIRLGSVLQTGFVILTLVQGTGIASSVRFSSLPGSLFGGPVFSNGSTGNHDLGTLLGNHSFKQIVSEMQSPENRELGLVVLDHDPNRFLCYVLCSWETRMDRFARVLQCPRVDVSKQSEHVFDSTEGCGRQVAIYPLGALHPPQPLDIEISFASLLDSSGTYLLILPSEIRRWFPDWVDSHVESCQLEASAPDIELWKCVTETEEPPSHQGLNNQHSLMFRRVSSG